MKKIIYFGVLILLSATCSNNGVIEKLNEVDSLVIHEQYDSADNLMAKIDTFLINNAETKAHYYLLKTQLACVLRKNDSINLLDNIIIPYYKETNNKEKLAEAFYYKGYINIQNGNIPEAITNYKRSEEQAAYTSNIRLKFKISENLSYANMVSGNYPFQLDYAQKSAKLATIIDNKGWIAFSLINIALAHSNLGNTDSSLFYMNQAAQLKEYVPNKEKHGFLINLAFTYKYNQPEIAKKYLHESLSIKETSYAIEHLADIYYEEGCQEEAYRLWKKALTINDKNPKDIILHNLLDYDIEHDRTDSVCQYVNEIIAIKDSIIDNLRNDTIKDLQLRFDHEAAMREQETITNNWQKGLLAAILLITLLIAYIIIKRYREKAKMQEAQMKINDLMVQMRELEKSEEDNSVAIQRLNDQIRDTIDKEDPLAKKGKILYNQIVEGGTVSDWHKSEFEAFNHYYTVINFQKVNKLKRIKRKEKLTTQKLFFLILVEMGYDKKEITRIFNFKETSVNTLYFRTKPIE